MKRLLHAGAALLSGVCAHSRDETTEPPSGSPELTVTDAALQQLAAGRAS